MPTQVTTHTHTRTVTTHSHAHTFTGTHVFNKAEWGDQQGRMESGHGLRIFI